MTAIRPDEGVRLSKEQMLYFMDLIIFVIIAAPRTEVGAQRFLEKHIDWWNGHVFDRRRVWEYLQFLFGDRHHVLKLGKTALFLQQDRKSIEKEADDTVFLISFNDDLLHGSYFLLPSVVNVCLDKLAAEFREHPISYFDDLLLVR